jgi:hypothetical protein
MRYGYVDDARYLLFTCDVQHTGRQKKTLSMDPWNWSSVSSGPEAPMRIPCRIANGTDVRADGLGSVIDSEREDVADERAVHPVPQVVGDAEVTDQANGASFSIDRPLDHTAGQSALAVDLQLPLARRLPHSVPSA